MPQNNCDGYSSPFYPVATESLHGYVTRISLLEAPTDITGIVRSDGWRKIPRVAPEVSEFLKRLPTEELEALIRSSCWFTGPYVSSLEITRLIELLLANSGVWDMDYLTTTPILFCKDCFKEQIKEVGFTFFKADWNFDDSCQIHDKPLCRFTPGGTVKNELDV